MRKNKYRYLYILQGNYGYGWDDLLEYDKSDRTPYADAVKDKKCYRENESQYRHRIIERRELNK